MQTLKGNHRQVRWTALHSKSRWSGCWWTSILGWRLCTDAFFTEKPFSKVCGKFQTQNLITCLRALAHYKQLKTNIKYAIKKTIPLQNNNTLVKRWSLIYEAMEMDMKSIHDLKTIIQRYNHTHDFNFEVLDFYKTNIYVPKNIGWVWQPHRYHFS
jgi:hypothetical protein